MDQSENRELAQRLRCKSLGKLSALSPVAGFGGTLNTKSTGNALLDVLPVQWDVEDGRHRKRRWWRVQSTLHAVARRHGGHSVKCCSIVGRADCTLAVTARSATFVQLCVGTHENRQGE